MKRQVQKTTFPAKYRQKGIFYTKGDITEPLWGQFIKFSLIHETAMFIMIMRKAEGSKMHTRLTAIILVSCVIPAAGTLPAVSENYRVSEVVSILSTRSFQCKLDDYKPAPSVRFRVTLPDTEGVTKETLTERLKSAKEIELRNVEFRNYFRVEADVWIDGQLFLERRRPALPQNESDSPKTPSNLTGYQLSTVSQWQNHPKRSTEQTVPVQRRPIAITALLDTPVDCSMLSDDTPLSEALTLLAESVQPRLPLLILWKDLQVNAFIQKETPIGVEGLGRIKLRQAMNIILRSVSAGGSRLVVVTEGGMITLGTEQALLSNKVTRVYAADDLLAPPSTGRMYNQDGNGNRGGGFSRY